MGKDTPDVVKDFIDYFSKEDVERIRKMRGATNGSVASEEDKKAMVDFIGSLEDWEKITVEEAREAGVSPAAIAYGIKNNIFQSVVDIEMHDLSRVIDNTDITIGDLQKRALKGCRRAQELKDEN